MNKHLNNCSMRYFSIMIMMLFSINLLAQSTSWNEYKLKEHWKTNGADEIEGIYENTVSEGSLTPKYTLGLVKTSVGYSLIYCKVVGDIFDIENGRKVSNNWRWTAGDVKAYLTSTATPYLFKTKWHRNRFNQR